MATAPQRKSEAINLRMTPEMKELLRLAAEREHRTLSNMLEVLVLEYCNQHGLKANPTARAKPKAGAKTTN
jgi:hypothetical protein